ncbi:hypothetical protein L916_08468, partial [Phytophthora nicotianae]
LSSTVAGRDTPSTLESILKQLVTINERLGRLEDAQAQRPATSSNASLVQIHHPAAIMPAVPPPATASALVGCLLNWYTNYIWQRVKGKQEQNKRAEAKAIMNIMVMLCHKTVSIPPDPTCSDTAFVAAYRSWKSSLWTLGEAMDNAVNNRIHSIDNKKPTRKAPSLHMRWKQLKTLHPDAVSGLGTQYLRMKTNGQIIDACTPVTRLWDAKEMSY